MFLYIQLGLLLFAILLCAVGIKHNAPRMFWVVAFFLVASAVFGVLGLIERDAWGQIFG